MSCLLQDSAHIALSLSSNLSVNSNVPHPSPHLLFSFLPHFPVPSLISLSPFLSLHFLSALILFIFYALPLFPPMPPSPSAHPTCSRPSASRLICSPLRFCRTQHPHTRGVGELMSLTNLFLFSLVSQHCASWITVTLHSVRIYGNSSEYFLCKRWSMCFYLFESDFVINP